MQQSQSLGREVTALAEVKAPADFVALYRAKNLQSLADKIRFLTEELGITNTRCEKEESLEEELLGLEEYALLHPWYCQRRP